MPRSHRYWVPGDVHSNAPSLRHVERGWLKGSEQKNRAADRWISAALACSNDVEIKNGGTLRRSYGGRATLAVLPTL